MSRKKQKKYIGVRFDRVAIVLIVFIGIIILISSLFKSCSRGDNTSTENIPQQVISQQDENVSYSFSSFESAIERLGFEKRSYSINDIHYGELILVNNDHQYIFNENKSADNVEIATVKNDFYNVLNSAIKLNNTAVENLNIFMKDYYSNFSDGSINISNGYRSKLEQDLVYNQALDNNIADNPAGFSDYHTGYAFDFTILPIDAPIQDFSTYANSSWILENCAKYGFIQRYPESKKSITGISNPTHFRYVSLPHSMYMQENNLCLEEYIAKLNSYKFGVQALRYTYNDQEYMIYLYEAPNTTTDTIEVYVPKDKEYTICGNNVNGFIITVKV